MTSPAGVRAPDLEDLRARAERFDELVDDAEILALLDYTASLLVRIDELLDRVERLEEHPVVIVHTRPRRPLA